MHKPNNRAKRWIALALAFLLLTASGEAVAQFRLQCDGFSALGGTSSSASNRLLAAAGQPHPIGNSTGANFALIPGIIPCLVRLEPPECTRCGDVNSDGLVNSTDALIILSCELGVSCPPNFKRECGDVNLDNSTNSTDALIILTCDVGLPQCPPNVGKQGGCR